MLMAPWKPLGGNDADDLPFDSVKLLNVDDDDDDWLSLFEGLFHGQINI